MTLRDRIYAQIKQVIVDYGGQIDYKDDGIEYADAILTLVKESLPPKQECFCNDGSIEYQINGCDCGAYERNTLLIKIHALISQREEKK